MTFKKYNQYLITQILFLHALMRSSWLCLCCYFILRCMSTSGVPNVLGVDYSSHVIRAMEQRRDERFGSLSRPPEQRGHADGNGLRYACVSIANDPHHQMSLRPPHTSYRTLPTEEHIYCDNHYFIPAQ